MFSVRRKVISLVRPRKEAKPCCGALCASLGQPMTVLDGLDLLLPKCGPIAPPRPMPKVALALAAVLCAFMVPAIPSSAANYFVDFAAGSDASTGTSTNAAWQHCPTDPNATGTSAAATLSAGDTVYFKGGVVYNGGLGSFAWNGTSDNPVTLQGLSSWGTGRAILDGTYNGGATTNNFAFLIGYTGGGDYTTVTGFEIRNYSMSGVQTFGNSTVVSNSIIHHIGNYPYVSATGGGGKGYGVYPRNCANVTIVSNLMYDLNETAAYVVYNVTNAIVWGNEFTNVQDHAVFFVSQGYGLIANNSIHDQTDPVSHDDAMHIMGWGFGTNALVVCNNRLWNNNQDIFCNDLGNSGQAYIFNNVLLNPSSTKGDGQDGAVNGIVINTQESPWDALYIFNNTILLKNAGSGAVNFAPRGGANWGTNVFLYNNIFWQSLVWEPQGTNSAFVHNTYSGFNVFTNASRTWCLSGSVGLSAFRSAYPAQEINSVYNSVFFSNMNSSYLPASNVRLTALSAGAGQGTNLTTLLPSKLFDFLPARYQVDPTMDAAGIQRGNVWDAGAFQHSPRISQGGPGAPTGFHIVGGGP
jgi:hypothetical protein